MTIQITSDETTKNNGISHRYVEMSSGSKSALFVVTTGEVNYVRVIVQNASHRAWKGMGKQFPTIAAAIENYKSADVKAMLESL